MRSHQATRRRPFYRQCRAVLLTAPRAATGSCRLRTSTSACPRQPCFAPFCPQQRQPLHVQRMHRGQAARCSSHLIAPGAHAAALLRRKPHRRRH